MSQNFPDKYGLCVTAATVWVIRAFHSCSNLNLQSTSFSQYDYSCCVSWSRITWLHTVDSYDVSPGLLTWCQGLMEVVLLCWYLFINKFWAKCINSNDQNFGLFPSFKIKIHDSNDQNFGLFPSFKIKIHGVLEARYAIIFGWSTENLPRWPIRRT